MTRPLRTLVMSDLHFEFHADGGAQFVESLDPTGIDVLVLAGDIAVADGIGPALSLFAKRFSDAKVLYVHGNHEFYGTSRNFVVAETLAVVAAHSNVAWLDCDVATVDGVRFLGAPLWFRPNGRAPKHELSDFRMIDGYERWVYAECQRAIRFFGELQPGDVAISHHLPAHASVASQYVDSPFNAFFLCDIEPLIREKRPSLWVHGHTHSSVDTRVGDTRIVCNPFGYVRREQNALFNERLVIDVGGADAS